MHIGVKRAIQWALIVGFAASLGPAFCQADLGQGTGARAQLARMNKILAELIALAESGDLTPRSLEGIIDGLRQQQISAEAELPAVYGIGYSRWSLYLGVVDSELDGVIGVDPEDVKARGGLAERIEVAYDAIADLITQLMGSSEKGAEAAVETLKGMMSSLLSAGEKYKKGIWDKDDLDRVLKDVVRRKYALMDELPAIHGHTFRSWYEACDALRISLLGIATAASLAVIQGGDTVSDLTAKLREAKRLKERLEEMFPAR